MKKSITFRIFSIFIIFIVLLFSIIAVLMATILPSYYRNRKIDNIQELTTHIRGNYETFSDTELLDHFDQDLSQKFHRKKLLQCRKSF
jgi:hypothetical protein